MIEKQLWKERVIDETMTNGGSGKLQVAVKTMWSREELRRALAQHTSSYLYPSRSRGGTRKYNAMLTQWFTD